MGSLTQDLADALGVPAQEAALEVEDSGIARMDSITRHAICTTCGGFRYEHLASEGFNDTCELGA